MESVDLVLLLADKTIKAKEKTARISEWLLSSAVSTMQLIALAKTAKDPAKATCIEALEFATKQKPELATAEVFEFVSNALSEKPPRIKWEAAKVIGNIVHLFPNKLDKTIAILLVNTEHAGTVVRWSAAYALAQILHLKNKYSRELIPAIEAICKREEKNSIKKIYLDALK